MKQLILLSILSMFAIQASGQNCRYEKNEVDRFTGLLVKQTKKKQVSMTWNTGTSLAFERNGDSLFVLLETEDARYVKVEKLIINAGSEMIFLTENNEQIKTKAQFEITGNSKFIPSLPPVYSTMVKNKYHISKTDLQTLLRHSTTVIRIVCSDETGISRTFDIEIKPKDQTQIKELIACIL